MAIAGTGNSATPSTCLATVGPGGEFLPSVNVWNDGILNIGFAWASGQQIHSWVTLAVPPNGPSCGSGGSGSRATIAASSYHPGGVNVLMADGAVMFVSNTIDAGNPTSHVNDPPWNHPGAPSINSRPYLGPSPYGVWGAMATISGGDMVRLD